MAHSSDLPTVPAPQNARPNLKVLLLGLLVLLLATAGFAYALFADSNDGSLRDASGIIDGTAMQQHKHQGAAATAST